jgi:hypothetical protein
MKTIYILILTNFLFLSSFGQSDEEFAALEEFISSEKLQYLMDNNYPRYQQLAVLNKAYYVGNFGEKNVSDLENALTVSKRVESLPELSESMITNGSLNLLGYNFEMSKSKYTYYRIAITDKVLVIPPTDQSLHEAGLETY